MKAKTIFQLMIALLLYSNVSSQTGLNATLNTFKRPTPLIGFNGAANFCNQTWTNQGWMDSVATLNIAMLRFPGGTNANHWDWQTGWWQNAPTTPTYVANLTNTCITRADEFKVGLTACNAKGLMVINFQHSNVTYQIQGLNYAISKGVAVDRIEMGNEHNIGSSAQQYIPAGTYATNGKIWADSLKAHFPSAKVCMVGGAVGTTTAMWHDSIFSKNPNIDALSFHLYLPAGNTDNKFFTRRALSMPFGVNTGVNYRYTTAKYTQTVIPSNIEIWATEFNMGEALSGCPIQHAGSWTHALYISAMSHLLMSKIKITVLLDHDIAGQIDFAAVDPNHKITANAVAMGLLGQTSKGTDSTALIDFNGQANITWSTTTYPSLIGWKFWKHNTENGWICNLSNQAIKVSMDQIIGGGFTYDNYFTDTNFVVNGIKSLFHAGGFSTDSVSFPPYSITTLNKQSTTLTQHLAANNSALMVYPNPSSGNLNIIFNNADMNVTKFKIYDLLGKEVDHKLIYAHPNGLSVDINGIDGIYFVEVQTSNGTLKQKFIIKN